MPRIKDVRALEILDSGGRPTVAAWVQLDGGAIGHAAVPSGSSAGVGEACELRDHDPRRYWGQGVLKAVSHVNGEIRDVLIGCDARDQGKIDMRLIDLDGTAGKSRLGANAVLAVSLATAKAAAASRGQPLYRYLAGLCRQPATDSVLPMPMMNIINGGAHADNNLDVQEFMIVPVGASSWREALRYGAEISHALKSILNSLGMSTTVGDEGAFAPELSSNESALGLILEATERAGLRPGVDVALALDVASSRLYSSGAYHFASAQRSYTTSQMVDLLASWVDRFPIVSIEDGMAEDDWQGWTQLSNRLGGRLQLVGDELFVTDAAAIRRGVHAGAANAALIKPNQIGTLTETIEAIDAAVDAGWRAVVAHRSGETEDTTIADLAVGSAATQIKTGPLCRSERIAKYNRLLEIESELGENATFVGRNAFPPLQHR